MKPIKISHSKSWIPWIRNGSSQLSQEIRGTSWHGGPLELLRVARAPALERSRKGGMVCKIITIWAPRTLWKNTTYGSCFEF